MHRHADRGRAPARTFLPMITGTRRKNKTARPAARICGWLGHGTGSSGGAATSARPASTGPLDGPPALMCSKEGGAPATDRQGECRIQYHYGQEYWGNFMKSLYTLFQVLTGESWSEAVARPLLEWSPGTNGHLLRELHAPQRYCFDQRGRGRVVGEDGRRGPAARGGRRRRAHHGGGRRRRRAAAPRCRRGALLSKLEAIQRQLDVLTAQRDGAVRAQPAAVADRRRPNDATKSTPPFPSRVRTGLAATARGRWFGRMGATRRPYSWAPVLVKNVEGVRS